MKIVLIAIVIQAMPLPATDQEPAATAILTTPVTVEIDDLAACANVARNIAKSIGDKLLSIHFSCSPKGMAKLEVETPPKPARPQGERVF